MLSVILSTFNRPDALGRALDGLARQEGAGEFEVVVADDGSGPSTMALMDLWLRKAPFPLIHTRQEHQGFRLARARNRAILASRGDRLVFLDGDCVPLAGFLRAHLAGIMPGSFLCGLRYYLGREETERLLEDPEGTGDGDLLRRVGRRERIRVAFRRILDRAYRISRLKDRPKPLGANLSVWRGDLEKANGFDERFEGWGHEDEDLARRLVRLGGRKRTAPAQARIVHLWHPSDPTFTGRAATSGNAPCLKRGFFLGRCRAGLQGRPLADLKARILGLPSLEPLFPRKAGVEEAAELSVFGPRSAGPPGAGGSPQPSPGPAEVRIAVAGPGTLPTKPLPRPGGPMGILAGAHAVCRVRSDLRSEETAREVVEFLEEIL